MSAPNNVGVAKKNVSVAVHTNTPVEGNVRSVSTSGTANVGVTVKHAFRPAKASSSVSVANGTNHAGLSSGSGSTAGTVSAITIPPLSTWQSYSPAVSAATSPVASTTVSPANSKPGSPRERFEATLESTTPQSLHSPTGIRRSTSSDFLSLDAPVTGALARPKLAATAARSIHPSGAHTARGLSQHLSSYEDSSPHSASSADSTPPSTIARPSPPTFAPPPIFTGLPADAITIHGSPPSSAPKVPPPTAMKIGMTSGSGSISSPTSGTATPTAPSSPGLSLPNHLFQSTPSNQPIVYAQTRSTPTSPARNGSLQSMGGASQSARSSPAPVFSLGPPMPATTNSHGTPPPPPPPPPAGWRPSSPHSLSNSAAASGDVKAMLKDLKKKEKEEKKAKKTAEKEGKKLLKEEKKKHKGGTLRSSPSAASIGHSGVHSSSELHSSSPAQIKRSTRDPSPTPSAGPSRSSSNATPPHSIRASASAGTLTTSSAIHSSSAVSSSGIGGASNFGNQTSPHLQSGGYASSTSTSPNTSSSPSELLRTIADSEEHGAPALTPGQLAVMAALQPEPVNNNTNNKNAPNNTYPLQNGVASTTGNGRIGNFPLMQPPPSSPAPEPPKKVTLADFRVIKLIGKGGFGEVYLVEHIEKKKKMALKVLDKRDIENETKMQQVLNERSVLVRSFKSPFLLSLSYCFQDSNYLYFAMKYCPGGDLRALLSAIGAFEEDEARLYMAEMILSVDALHRLGYIHRDLKPDNFLIDDQGHLVLADFGLSKGMYATSRKSKDSTPSNANSGRTPQNNQASNQVASEISSTTTPQKPQLARERSLSTIAPQPVSTHTKAPSLLLGPQDLVGLNAANVDSRFIRRRRRGGGATDMTSSFNPMMTSSFNPMMAFSYNPSMAATYENGADGNSAGNGFSYDGASSAFGTGSYVPNGAPSSFRASTVFESDSPMSLSYNPMMATFGATPVRPVIQLSDLPSKAQTRRLMAYSVVGSPDYMSPEVLAEHGYGAEVDWWSVGCLCFELVLGIPPFTGQSIQEVFDNIANWETRLPQILEQYSSYLSPPCYDLLCGLLCDPSKRLGKNGISEIQKHPFFEGLDWSKLHEEEPPFVPRLENEEDTSYFEANVVNKQQLFLPKSSLAGSSSSVSSTENQQTQSQAHNTQNNNLSAHPDPNAQPSAATPPIAENSNPNEYYKQFSYCEADLAPLRQRQQAQQ